MYVGQNNEAIELCNTAEMQDERKRQETFCNMISLLPLLLDFLGCARSLEAMMQINKRLVYGNIGFADFCVYM